MFHDPPTAPIIVLSFVCTGQPLTADPYVAYLHRKYEDIYGLK